MVTRSNKTSVNPGFAGGAYGYVAMGPYQGGQAQFLRVPYADFNALKLPPGKELEADFALLSDIFPTVSVYFYREPKLACDNSF